MTYCTRDVLAPWQHSALGGFAYDYVSACIPQLELHVHPAASVTRIPFDALYDEAMWATDKRIGNELAQSATSKASIS